MKINEIMKQQNQMPIPNFEGTIQKVYPQETKQWEDKTFKTQNLVLADDTGVIYAQVVDRELIDKTEQGKSIKIECFTSKQHGLTGIKLDKYPKKDGGEGIKVKITKSALMQIGTPDEYAPVEDVGELPKEAAKTDTLTPKEVYEIEKNMERKEKLRSMAVSYAKDLLCAKVIGFRDIEKYADLFFYYIVDNADINRDWTNTGLPPSNTENAETEGEELPF